MREIDVSTDLLPRHHEVMRCMGLLGTAAGTDLWCVVGGMMVLIVAREAGRRESRAEHTKDGDVLADVVTDPRALERITHHLQNLGYELSPDIVDDHDFARCTFVSGTGQVDVLAPDDAANDQLDVDGAIRTIAIPGGRRALEGATRARILYTDDAFEVEIRVPTLVTATIVKAAAAVDPRTGGHPRHVQDAAFLLACMEDPDAAQHELRRDDPSILRRLYDERLRSRSDVAWQDVDDEDRRRAVAALDLLLR